ncbi:MAG: hypothetical protein JKX85_04425 [Phycisphaeraceae bacterium]|nr:hypothetical protein [Phycisphaeraceae bacterium]
MSKEKMRKPLLSRQLYCPSHFGNTYEATMPTEMTALLHEAKFWGFNKFADWFNGIDLCNIYNDNYNQNHRQFNMPEALWERKFSNYKCASDLGFDLGLNITPNHVFLDQLTPENRAEAKTRRYFGQLVCPSKPEVTDMILENYRNLFRDFVEHGLQLDSISAIAYDYGGCSCDQCNPWVVTFGKLYKEISSIAKDVFGEINIDILGWWWSDEDHQNFTNWADTEAPGLFHSLAFFLDGGATKYAVRPIPKNCKEDAFVHIAYSEHSDIYTHYGANIAPDRIEKTIENLFSRKAAGVMAYSEGDHDDINKAIAGGLASGQFASADEVLQEYAARYFGTNPKRWSELIYLLGDFNTIDIDKCKPLFKNLSKDSKKSWRLQQIEERINMAKAHQSVMAEVSDAPLMDAVYAMDQKKSNNGVMNIRWTPRQKVAAEEFVAAKERLYREVYRLGVVRHIFRFGASMPCWYESFIRMKNEYRKKDFDYRC